MLLMLVFLILNFIVRLRGFVGWMPHFIVPNAVP